MLKDTHRTKLAISTMVSVAIIAFASLIVNSYLPKLMLYLHSLNPVIIDEQVQKFKVYLN